MFTVKRKIDIVREAHGRIRLIPLRSDPKPPKVSRTPRISRLMALAIRLERLIISGEVTDITELARLGHVTQPRISQILNLALLAPDIQEALLFLPRVVCRRATLHEKMLRPVTMELDWAKQREAFRKIAGRYRLEPDEAEG